MTPDASLCRVRHLESLERVFEAKGELEQAIGFAASLSDVAVCLYRLAYMEWKLGRSDLSAACYVRAIELGRGNVVANAEEELRDLVDSEQDVARPEPAEAVRMLEEADIPVGDPARIVAQAGRAAAACVDAGRFLPARGLLAVVFEADRDDALLGAHRSLL